MKLRDLKKSNEVKRLIASSIYLKLYMNRLEEFVDKNTGNIYLYEYGDNYANISFIKKNTICWVSWSFWKRFSDEFYLTDHEVRLIITIWVEDTYQLELISTNTIQSMVDSSVHLEIPK